MQRKNSEYVPIRIPLWLAGKMDLELKRRENHPLYPPWTRTGFILAAIREKIDKMRRSRSCRRKRKSKRVVVIEETTPENPE